MISQLEFYLRRVIRLRKPSIAPILPKNLNVVQIARIGLAILLTQSYRISHLKCLISSPPSS